VLVVKSQIKYYWTGILFALISVGLFVLGVAYSEERSLLVGAGSALAGATFTRVADQTREHRAEQAAARANHQRDLDETRRVAYMALLCGKTDRYEVAATTINALVHHGAGVDFSEAFVYVIAAVQGGRSCKAKVGRAWLQEQIGRITGELAE
jgi:hypothetical protein